MDKLSRRSFFRAAGGAAAALAAQPQALAAAPKQPPRPAAARAQPATYLFFRPDEAAFIEAATERLIPADANGPGAREAGVGSYIDRQLAGAWGAGERLYRSGPWQQGEASQGYQLPFTPAELFRNGLRGVAALAQQQYHKPFAQLTAQQQDTFLEALQKSSQDLEGVPGHVFFESLLAMTIEGFFSDPVYGGNHDMASWRMIGFPGAYASFYDLVDQHGVAYTREPISIGDNGRGVIKLHPVHGPTAHGPNNHGGS
ncbi:MAG TPA: gluconate 2-dehydrogenase subunit 3 family protein [Pseudoduganella sp.]|jgi:gluconate 2-dehydrogenase gamma chain